jgi:hypothetical protein
MMDAAVIEARDVASDRGLDARARRRSARDASAPDVVTDAPLDAGLRVETPGCPRPSEPGFARATLCDFDFDQRKDWCSSDIGLMVAHARADGTCSFDDDAAQRMASSLCPWPPSALVYRDFMTAAETEQNTAYAVANRVACARMWGASAEATIERFRREFAAVSGEDAAVPAWSEPVRFNPQELAQIELAARLTPLWTQSPSAMRSLLAARAAPRSDAAARADAASPDAASPRNDGDPWEAPWRSASQDATQQDASAPRALVGASAAVQRECAAIERRAGALVDRNAHLLVSEDAFANGDLSRVELVKAMTARCYATVGGAWAFEATRARRTSEGVSFELQLRWLGDDGVRASEWLDRSFEMTWCDTDWVEQIATSDMDDDGRGELVFQRVAVWCGEGDGANESPITVRAVRGRSIVTLPLRLGSTEVHAWRAEDVDGDGRMDFWDNNYYPRTNCSPSGISGSLHTVFPVLMHGLGGGALTLDDAVTRAVFLQRCRSLRADFELPLAEEDRDDEFDTALFNERAICARAAGWTPAEIQREVILSIASSSSRPSFQCNDFTLFEQVIFNAPPFAQPLVGAFRPRP